VKTRAFQHLTVVAAVVAAGIVVSAQGTKTGTAQAPAAPSLKNPASLTAKAPATFKAKFDTSAGEFVIDVTRAWAPLGADRFYNLVKNGFYNDARFYRVIAGFMAQIGINGDPAIQAAWRGASIKDDPVVQSNKRGFVAFAMGGVDTRTTQFFISYRDNSTLDAQGFAAFGEVTTGMDVVDKLNSEYGDSASRGGKGPEQPMIQSQGNVYLKRDFPKLDYVKTATIVK